MIIKVQDHIRVRLLAIAWLLLSISSGLYRSLLVLLESLLSTSNNSRQIATNICGTVDTSISNNNNQQYDSKGKLKGLVIDLRGNSGGLLTVSTNILDYLTEKNDILLESYWYR